PPSVQDTRHSFAPGATSSIVTRVAEGKAPQVGWVTFHLPRKKLFADIDFSFGISWRGRITAPRRLLRERSRPSRPDPASGARTGSSVAPRAAPRRARGPFRDARGRSGPSAPRSAGPGRARGSRSRGIGREVKDRRVRGA